MNLSDILRHASIRGAIRFLTSATRADGKCPCCDSSSSSSSSSSSNSSPSSSSPTFAWSSSSSSSSMSSASPWSSGWGYSYSYGYSDSFFEESSSSSSAISSASPWSSGWGYSYSYGYSDASSSMSSPASSSLSSAASSSLPWPFDSSSARNSSSVISSSSRSSSVGSSSLAWPHFSSPAYSSLSSPASSPWSSSHKAESSSYIYWHHSSPGHHGHHHHSSSTRHSSNVSSSVSSWIPWPFDSSSDIWWPSSSAVSSGMSSSSSSNCTFTVCYPPIPGHRGSGGIVPAVPGEMKHGCIELPAIEGTEWVSLGYYQIWANPEYQFDGSCYLSNIGYPGGVHVSITETYDSKGRVTSIWGEIKVQGPIDCGETITCSLPTYDIICESDSPQSSPASSPFHGYSSSDHFGFSSPYSPHKSSSPWGSSASSSYWSGYSSSDWFLSSSAEISSSESSSESSSSSSSSSSACTFMVCPPTMCKSDYFKTEELFPGSGSSGNCMEVATDDGTPKTLPVFTITVGGMVGVYIGGVDTPLQPGSGIICRKTPYNRTGVTLTYSIMTNLRFPCGHVFTIPAPTFTIVDSKGNVIDYCSGSNSLEYPSSGSDSSSSECKIKLTYVDEKTGKSKTDELNVTPGEVITKNKTISANKGCTLNVSDYGNGTVNADVNEEGGIISLECSWLITAECGGEYTMTDPTYTQDCPEESEESHTPGPGPGPGPGGSSGSTGDSSPIDDGEASGEPDTGI